MIQKIWNEKNYLVWEDAVSSGLDHVAVGMLEQNHIEGLLPFRMLQKNEESDFRYEIREGTSLEEWLEGVHIKREVLELLESIIALEEEAEYFLLESSHLCTERGSVIVCGNRCRLAYIPVTDYQEGSCIGLVRDILFRLRYAMDEDYTYLFELMNGMGRKDIRSLRDLKKWLKKLNEGSSASAFQSQKADRLPTQSVWKESGEKKGIFSFLKKEEKGQGEKKMLVPGEPENAVAKPPMRRMHLIGEEDEYEETGIISADEGRAALIRRSTSEEINLTGACLILGSGRQTADICISDNPAVSRRHAKLYEGGEQWYLEDLGSTNGTYVNGERIMAGTSRCLRHEDRIRLADEEFIFV